MLPDSPQNIVVVRAPSPSVHYISNGINSENIVLPTANHQQLLLQPVHSLSQPVSESWCLTSVKVIKVCLEAVVCSIDVHRFVLVLFQLDDQ